MFDEVTSRLIAQAPPLEGLEPASLREELTSAYVEIAAARLAMGGDLADRSVLDETAGRMGRLADAYEARIVLGLDPQRMRATAFVAASARQVVASVGRLTRIKGPDEEPEVRPTRLDEDAIGAELAAALLFLIAERSSDAFEAARDITAAGEPDPIRRALILAVGRLARGRLGDILEIDPAAEALRAADMSNYAVDLLYRELLSGVLALAAFGLGRDGAEGWLDEARGRFARARDLSIDATETMPVGEIDELAAAVAPRLPAPVFGGPHHLASLLLRAADTLGQGILVRTPAPLGSDAARWHGWLRTEAARWPYLWENHRRALATGYLDAGQSLIMTSPTGSGKTTLAALKIAAAITAGKTVLYLAPTHALVSQIERDLNERIGDIVTAESVEDAVSVDDLRVLPSLAVLTPERCFALLTFAPELFVNVGLLVFDEFHLMGAPEATPAAPRPRVDRRAIDAMLCLLTFISVSPESDLLLLSAMVSNGGEVAGWLGGLLGRPVHSFDDRWKPTRQLRACVTYDRRDLRAAHVVANTRGGRPEATPWGLFCLTSGWNPLAVDKLAFRPFAPGPVALNRSQRPLGRRWITANRLGVAAAIAERFARSGQKVIVFCDSITFCMSVANGLNSDQPALPPNRDEDQTAWRDAAISELGDVSGIYDAGHRAAAVHHGDLLPDERRLVESLFRDRESGLNILAATSTLAQGLNLPCEVVILAGTDRLDDNEDSASARKPLEPHEILNALGRAGRAGQAATGVAIVVPGDPIGFDPATRMLDDSPDLPVVFSDGDQCLPVADPLAALFDQIEVAGVPAPEADYLLRRLSDVLGDDGEAFETLARRTFGYHRRAAADVGLAQAWLTGRRNVLVAAIRARAEPPALPWEEALAAKTGVSRRLISALAAAYPGAPHDQADALPWAFWLIDQLDPAQADFDAVLRPEGLTRVFGRACSTQPDPVSARRMALGGLRAVLPGWFSGAPLLAIEAVIAGYVAANERHVTIPTRPDPKAKRARRFAQRLASDLGYLCGILAQVAASLHALAGQEPPPMVMALPQLMRKGFQTPYHFALSRSSPALSRVAIYGEFDAVAGLLTRSPDDDWQTVRDKLSQANIALIFGDLGDDLT
jgi:hypothetical protein